MEAVRDGAFTEVLTSPKGKVVRADFSLVREQRPRLIVWAQQVEQTPFARVLKSAETEIGLAAVDGGERPSTQVWIEMRQSLRGFMAKLGSRLVKRAAIKTIEDALDGLELIVGR